MILRKLVVLALVLGLVAAPLEARADFITGNTSLITSKSDLYPLGAGANPNNYIRAVDYNNVTQALIDTRNAITQSTYIGFTPQVSAPSPVNASNFLWLDSAGAMHFKFGVSDTILGSGSSTTIVWKAGTPWSSIAAYVSGKLATVVLDANGSPTPTWTLTGTNDFSQVLFDGSNLSVAGVVVNDATFALSTPVLNLRYVFMQLNRTVYSGAADGSVLLEGSVLERVIGTSGPLITTTGALTVDMKRSTTANDDLTDYLLKVGALSTIAVETNSTVDNKTIDGTAPGVSANYSFDDTTTETAGAFGGNLTVSKSFNSSAAREAYMPAVPGNWSPAPSITADALDQLAARVPTSGALSGTLTSGRLPVASGAHSLGDSSFTASGNTLDLSAAGALTLGGTNASSVDLRTAGTTWWSVNSSGTLFPSMDNTLQIGGTSNRVLAFVGSVLQSGSSAAAADTTGHSLTLNSQAGGAASITGGGTGGNLVINANAGGDGGGAVLGGVGGSIIATAGTGGAGTASIGSRGGGSISLTAGTAGADGGAGGNSGGNISLVTGNGTGALASGNLFINIPTPPGAGAYGRVYIEAGGTQTIGIAADAAVIYPITTLVGILGGAGNVWSKTYTANLKSGDTAGAGVNGTDLHLTAQSGGTGSTTGGSVILDSGTGGTSSGSIQFRTNNSGFLNFFSTSIDEIAFTKNTNNKFITVNPAAADTSGNALSVFAGSGGAASATGGGNGANLSLTGGSGGNGTGALNPGTGGGLVLSAGPPGSGGSGNASSGSFTFNIPAPVGTGSYGTYTWQFGGTSTLRLDQSSGLHPTTTDTLALGNSGAVWHSASITSTNTNAVDALTATQLNIGTSTATTKLIGRSGQVTQFADNSILFTNTSTARTVGFVTAATDTAGQSLTVAAQAGGVRSATANNGGALNLLAGDGSNGSGGAAGNGADVLIQSGGAPGDETSSAFGGSINLNLGISSNAANWGLVKFKANGTLVASIDHTGLGTFNGGIKFGDGTTQTTAATGASTGNWTFSGNDADLTAAGTMGIGLTTATALTLGGTGMDVALVSSNTVRVWQNNVTHSTAALDVKGGTLTNLTASTEQVGISLNQSATKTWAAGALTTQREVYVQAPTYAFTSASTITNAATVAISAAPSAGTNATLTNSWALWLQAGNLGLAPGASIKSASAGATNTTGLSVLGNVANGASSVALKVGSSASMATGKLLSVVNGSTEFFSMDAGGIFNIIGNGIIANISQAGAGSTAMFIQPNVADGASSVALAINTATTLANAGAKILSVQNQGIEKFAFTGGGKFFATGVGVNSSNVANYTAVFGPDLGAGASNVVASFSKGAATSASLFVGASLSAGLEFGWNNSTSRAYINTGTGVPIAISQNGTDKLYIAATELEPATDNVFQLGDATHRFKGVYNSARVTGGFRAVTTTPITATVDDYIIGVNRTSATTINLPAASTCTPGQTLLINNMVGTSPTISITANGTDTINGATTQTISRGYGGYVIWTDGVSQWFISGSN